MQRLAGNLSNEKQNSARIKAELQSTKSILGQREIELGRQIDNVQKLNAAVANLETHKALLQVVDNLIIIILSLIRNLTIFDEVLSDLSFS